MIPLDKIKTTLRVEDVEDYISLGAPENEYDSEAEALYDALKKAADRPGEDEIMATLVPIWGKFFELDEDDMKKRLPYLQRVARSLVSQTEDL